MQSKEVIEEVMFLSVNPGSTFEYEGVRYVLCLDGHQGEFGCYRRCIQMDTGKVNYLGPRKVKLVKHNPESPAIYVPLHKRFTDSEVKVANYRLREQLQAFLALDPAKVSPKEMKEAQDGAQLLIDFKYQDKLDLFPDLDYAVGDRPEATPKTDPSIYEDGRLRWTNKHQRMTWEEAKEIEKRDAPRYPHLRLPTVRELVSLFDYAEGKSAAFGIGMVWASEKCADDTDEYAWSVDLSSGEVMRAVTWDVESILWVQE